MCVRYDSEHFLVTDGYDESGARQHRRVIQRVVRIPVEQPLARSSPLQRGKAQRCRSPRSVQHHAQHSGKKEHISFSAVYRGFCQLNDVVPSLPPDGLTTTGFWWSGDFDQSLGSRSSIVILLNY